MYAYAKGWVGGGVSTRKFIVSILRARKLHACREQRTREKGKQMKWSMGGLGYAGAHKCTHPWEQIVRTAPGKESKKKNKKEREKTPTLHGLPMQTRTCTDAKSAYVNTLCQTRRGSNVPPVTHLLCKIWLVVGRTLGSGCSMLAISCTTMGETWRNSGRVRSAPSAT